MSQIKTRGKRTARAASQSVEVCRACGGRDTYEDKVIEYHSKFKGVLAIVDNVPAQVCRQCGEILFSSDTVRRLSKVGDPATAPTGVVEVPVYDFGGVV